jgi:hypothetical protein
MLVCLSGRLWATQESSGDDHLLEAGGRWSCGGMGKLVVQALKPSTVRLERPRPVLAGAGSTLRPLVQPG